MYLAKLGLKDNNSGNYYLLNRSFWKVLPKFKGKDAPMQDSFEAMKIKKEKQKFIKTDFVLCYRKSKSRV